MCALVLDLCADTSKAVRVSSSMTAAVFVAEMVLVNGTVILGIVSAPARMRQMINIKKTIAQVGLNILIFLFWMDNGDHWRSRPCITLAKYSFCTFAYFKILYWYAVSLVFLLKTYIIRQACTSKYTSIEITTC